MNRRGPCLCGKRVAIEGKIVAERKRRNGVTGKRRGERVTEKIDEKIGNDG